MAQRYGGKYSPDGSRTPGAPLPLSNPYDGKVPTRAGFRVNALFALPFVFLLTAFTGPPAALFTSLAAAALLFLAAWLTRDGVKAEEAYDSRKVARRPAIPRKIFGSVLTGLALGLGAMMTQGGVIYPALFAVVGAALHLGSFGPDPLRDKGLEGVDTFQTDRVAKAVDEAETLLAAMKDAILRAGDRSLETRVDRFAATARNLFRSVEADPGDLTAARKYLSVYLMGARDATVKFADIFKQSRDAKARADYEALLTDLETTFASRTTALLSGSHSDLDVEISVLRDRLKMEA
jgi:hypothetical protein